MRSAKDKGAHIIGESGWDLAAPEEGRRMECQMVDGISCVQETYTLRRDRQFFHFSFKVDRNQHRKLSRTFRLVAQSALLGIED